MGINTKQEGCYAVLKPVTKSHWNENISPTRTNFSFVLVGFRSSIQQPGFGLDTGDPGVTPVHILVMTL